MLIGIMKIALINPSYTQGIDETQFMKKVLGSMAPLGLLSLASYAMEHIEDIDIRIIGYILITCIAPRNIEFITEGICSFLVP